MITLKFFHFIPLQMHSLHPELAQGDHSGLFLMVAAALVTSAFLGVFAIQKPLPRIVFALAFSYCSAHVIVGWAFPASIGLDSPHSGAFHLPWVIASD